MKFLFRILSIIPAVLFFVMGMTWIFSPRTAANNLGMDLLSGAAASTQIGDIGAFFFSVSFFCAYGQLRGKSAWLAAAGVLLGSAAVLRTLAWLLGYADFATSSIVAEVVFTTILVVAARLRADEA